ncbi:MAG: hypothetical protein H6739_35630 [Alphaproteobacteria bacterium]|nr:hypothetical protein [Alphaproteobacteria bacterium]
MRTAPTAVGCAMLALAAALSPAAFAGGVGVFTTGGFHQENIYVYDSYDVENPDTVQTIVYQQRPNYGFGIQGLLGDRDDRVLGLMKFYYMSDSPPIDSGVIDKAQAKGAEPGEDGLLYALPRTEARPMGLALAGVQWGILPDPGALQLNAVTSLGAGVLTNDNTEFILAEVGAGAHYGLTEQIQINAELAYNLRIRKNFYHGVNANLGVRFMFD